MVATRWPAFIKATAICRARWIYQNHPFRCLEQRHARSPIGPDLSALTSFDLWRPYFMLLSGILQVSQCSSLPYWPVTALKPAGTCFKRLLDLPHFAHLGLV